MVSLRFAWPPRWWRRVSRAPAPPEPAEPLFEDFVVPPGLVSVAEPPDMEESRSSAYTLHWSPSSIDVQEALRLANQHEGKPVVTVEARVHEIEESLAEAYAALADAELREAAQRKKPGS